MREMDIISLHGLSLALTTFSLLQVSSQGLQCPAGPDSIVSSELSWPATEVNTTASQPCPPGAHGNVSRACLLGAENVALWAKPDLTGCTNDAFADLKEMAFAVEARNPHVEKVTRFLDQLTNTTDTAARAHALYPRDVTQATDWVTKAAANTAILDGVSSANTAILDGVSSGVYNYTRSFSSAASALCDNNTAPAWANMPSQVSARRTALDIVEAVSIMAASLLLVQSHEHSAHAPNLDFIVQPFMTNHARSASDTWAVGGPYAPAPVLMTSSSYVELPGADVTVRYPEEMLNKASRAESLLGSQFGLYRAHFSTLHTLLHEEEPRIQLENRSLQFASGAVVAVEVLGIDSSVFAQLTTPVEIVFRHKEPLPSGYNATTCVFIRQSALPAHRPADLSSNLWGDAGCEAAHVNSTHTVCHCYHLTNFALLMDLYEMDLAPVHEEALSYISFVGGSLSVLGCVLSLFVYIAFKLTSERVRIHQMLAASIIITQMSFFIGFQRAANSILCRALAIGLHYSLTAMFCWMLVEGVHLYLSLIKVFHRATYFNKYLVVGWVVPLVSVVVAASVFIDEYAVDGKCWMSKKLLLIGFLPFVCLTITVNVVILAMVLRVMMRSLRSRHEDLPSVKTGLKAILILLPLLGLTWVFGLMSTGSDATLVFTYLFTVCNSMQGVFFFIFHCALNTDVRQALSYTFTKRSDSCSSQPVITGTAATGSSSSPRLSQTPADEMKGRDRFGGEVTDDKQTTAVALTERDLRCMKRVSASSIDSGATNQTQVDDGDVFGRQLSDSGSATSSTRYSPRFRTSLYSTGSGRLGDCMETTFEEDLIICGGSQGSSSNSDVTTRGSPRSGGSLCPSVSDVSDSSAELTCKQCKEKCNRYRQRQRRYLSVHMPHSQSDQRAAAFRERNRPPTPTPDKKHLILTGQPLHESSLSIALQQHGRSINQPAIQAALVGYHGGQISAGKEGTSERLKLDNIWLNLESEKSILQNKSNASLSDNSSTVYI